MRRSHIIGGGAALTGAAVLAGLAARRLATDATEAIDDWTGDVTPPAWHGAAYGGIPVVYHRAQMFGTFHAASRAAVQAALPSDVLHAVTLPNGRAVVNVNAIHWQEVTAYGIDGQAALPYGEVMVSALVTTRPAPPLVPLIAPARSGLAAGVFILHLPVTTRVARDAGREGWGMPKFIADMDFDESVARRSVALAEGGRMILELHVRPRGGASVDREPLVTYSVLDGWLVETVLPCHGFRQRWWGTRGGQLLLGDHPVAEDLRRFDIAAEPFLGFRAAGLQAVMPAGRPIAPARPYAGYAGEERALGRYVVRHPGTAPIDQYAPFAPTAGPAATVLEASSPVVRVPEREEALTR